MNIVTFGAAAAVLVGVAAILIVAKVQPDALPGSQPSYVYTSSGPSYGDYAALKSSPVRYESKALTLMASTGPQTSYPCNMLLSLSNRTTSTVSLVGVAEGRIGSTERSSTSTFAFEYVDPGTTKLTDLFFQGDCTGKAGSPLASVIIRDIYSCRDRSGSDCTGQIGVGRASEKDAIEIKSQF